MTAVMRAAALPTGSRALRAALVRGGRIVDERILPVGEHLTVGPTERSAFVVAGLPGSVRLLEWSRAGYKLHLRAGMSGRVALGGEVAEIEGRSAPAPIALDDGARGKIAIGDALVLFHFVEPPVRAPRPQLPLAVRRGVFDGLDWRTTCIAAFSFLFHFGAVGTAYADFADTTIEDDGARVIQTVGILRTLPPVLPAVETHDEEKTAGAEKPQGGDHPAPRAAPRAGNPAPGRGGPSHPTGGGDRPSDVRAREIARQLTEEGSHVLVAIGGQNGGSIGRVLEAGELPLPLLDDPAKDAGGTRTGGAPGLNLPMHAAVVLPGRGGGLPGAADIHGEAHEGNTGVAAGPKKPVPSTTVSPPSVDVGRVPDAPKVVGGLRSLLRACYRHELDTDPNAKGSVRVTAKIGSNGEVTSVQAAASGLSSTMVACVSRVVRGAQFGSPEGGGAMVTIPMTFIPQ
jgi:hypothetical protein